ncbi:hypothetical protein ARALYDRAFT_919693 [Arabidopsis lyrata subsp. lyrata]|uniref:fructose-bisphosphate aldolase n=1 Tax=Arabidopsis lyrata subsp. lyrata TaxID=81972 RepID=D7MQJ1_ARALL|nr:hypothetical protein ARALYDRAFT_919693 [Arabidopsis lyrata subsp. lyrata]
MGTTLENDPSHDSILKKATRLAGYALTVQMNRLALILHLDVLVDEYHSATRCYEVTIQILQLCYETLKDHKVFLSGTLLIINLVTFSASLVHLSHMSRKKSMRCFYLAARVGRKPFLS